jgi:hypothetical protein
MESPATIQGHFKYAHYEITWTREELPSGGSSDTITRTYAHGLDYSETVKLEDPGAAADRFLKWTMSLSCLTDEQAALKYFTSLMREHDLELARLWHEVIAAAQEAQATCRAYLEMKYDPERQPAERTKATAAYLESRKRLLAALAELKLVKPPEQQVPVRPLVSPLSSGTLPNP